MLLRSLISVGLCSKRLLIKSFRMVAHAVHITGFDDLFLPNRSLGSDVRGDFGLALLSFELDVFFSTTAEPVSLAAEAENIVSN